MGKIRKYEDYWNPKNLWSLRNCNIEYGKAYHKFKEKKYEVAKDMYEAYLLKYNSIDLDAQCEVAICYLHLSNKKDLDQKTRLKYLEKGIKYLKIIIKKKPKNKTYLKKLIGIGEVYKVRKDHRAIDHILPSKISTNNLEELIKLKDEMLESIDG